MYPGSAKKRIQLAILGAGKSSTVTVWWRAVAGGVADSVTGALVGGMETEVSGTMRGLTHQVAAQTQLRQFAEIQVGDMMLDIDPAAVVTIYSGQLLSGTVTLDDIARQGVRFGIDGQQFTQKDIGENLAQAWNVLFADQELIRTILLRKAT
jgi:hypothetical protein